MSLETSDSLNVNVRNSLSSDILKSAQAMIIATDLNGSVLTVNPATVQILGRPPDHFIGKPFPLNCFTMDELTSKSASLSRSLEREILPGFELFQTIARLASPVAHVWTLVRENGSTITAIVSISTMQDDSGDDVGFVFAALPCDDGCREHPEHQKLNRALEERLQRQKLQAVGQLASGIAHDFNNFLLLISFCSEQLLSQLPIGDDRRKSVSAISDAGLRAAGLTRQLLAFSQRQTLQVVPIDLNELIVRTDQIFRRLISHTISVGLRLTPNAAMVNIDTDQFEHVLLNLVLNAQDAMPDGGLLTLETTVENGCDVNHDCENPFAVDRWIRLAVTDSGCGMIDEVRSRIFEPYFTTKAAGKGTGLGLAVVHGIINQLNGKISVQSSVGQGTTIEIWLPEAVGAVSSAEPVADESQNRESQRTILLVEDESNLRQLLRTSLESQGYRVLEARHGPAAIAVAVRHAKPIDLLLTDMELPEMSGSAVAQVLRDDQPDLPALFISGAGGAKINDTHPADSFLPKPFKTSHLLQLVREILENRLPFEAM